jgi:2-polyprenyl-6-hydroxyphenyl methylase/3-demethylubiquinone-9 3-methyltransferase
MSMTEELEVPDEAGSLPWWRDPDPASAHRKYLAMHASSTNRAKAAVTLRLLERFDWAGKSVLEYGCGGGYFTVWMAGRGARVTAIELSPCAMGAVRHYATVSGVADRVHVVEGNAERDTVPGQYDFIFAKDLVEHLDDDRPFFRRLGEQLRPGGWTYVATQNDHSLNYLLEGGYQRFYRGNRGWFGWDKTHKRFYNAPMLARRLREAGIRPRAWGSSYLVPWRFVTRVLTGRPRPAGLWGAIDRALGTLPPFSRWGWSIMVLGEKALR